MIAYYAIILYYVTSYHIISHRTIVHHTYITGPGIQEIRVVQMHRRTPLPESVEVLQKLYY